MLTGLDPEYKFTDGPAIIVGDYPYAVEGDKIKVYIPSLMPEVPYQSNEKVYHREAADNTIFLNDNHPNFKGIVETTTCVPAKLTGDLVIKLANAKLYERTEDDVTTISYIPRKVEVKAGTEVVVNSNMGTFKDLDLY